MSNSKLSTQIKALSVCAFLWTATAFVITPTTPAFAQDSGANSDTPADNTGINQRDRSPQQLTADQAGQHMTDRDIMRKIRKSIVADKTLSTYAHNIKIISKNGSVTLKGPVRSDDEKQNVIGKATAVAGGNHVVDQIAIQSSSSN